MFKAQNKLEVLHARLIAQNAGATGIQIDDIRCTEDAYGKRQSYGINISDLAWIGVESDMEERNFKLSVEALGRGFFLPVKLVSFLPKWNVRHKTNFSFSSFDEIEDRIPRLCRYYLVQANTKARRGKNSFLKSFSLN